MIDGGLKRRNLVSRGCGVSFIVLSALVAACSKQPQPGAGAAPQSSVLTVGVAEGAAISGGIGVSQFARMLVLEGLTQINPDGRVAPRLAEGWTWEADGRQLRVNLRRNIRFHDGSALDAERAAAILRTIIQDRANWASYPSLQDVSGITTPTKFELLFELHRPSALLPEDLSIAIPGQTPRIGTGPFRVVTSPDNQTVLERFDQYHQGTPAISRVIVRPFADLRLTWASLLRREVDMVTDVPASSLGFIESDEVRVVTWRRWYQFVMAFNSRGQFRSPAVRRALNMAVDREALINRVLPGVATASTGPVWPDYWAYDSSAPAVKYDMASAESLLDSVGFRRGAGAANGIAPTTRLRFTCLVAEGYSVLERVGLELQRQLYAIGVDVEFETIPPDHLQERLRTGKFDAVLVDMISGPSLGRPFLFWRSGTDSSGLNMFGYKNAEVDRLYDTLRGSSRDAVVLSVTSRLQRALRDDPPALFLAWTSRARAVRREFRVHQEPGRDPLATLWQWTPEQLLQSAAVK